MGNLEKSETSITKVSNTDEDEDSRTNLNKVGLPSNKTSKGEEATGVNRQEIDGKWKSINKEPAKIIHFCSL